MSRQRYRGNTLSAAFPLLSSFSGRSVIVPSIDQYYLKTSAAESDINIGIPHVIFMENVMPMINGLQSVGFDFVISGGPSFDFDQAFYLKDQNDRKKLFVPANGKNYLYRASANYWEKQIEPTPFGAMVTTANIKGRQFICYAKHSTFFEWDGGSLLPIEFLGLDPTKILGIVAANAYLVAYTEREIFWSSIITPTDFVPSLESGAGGSDILALRGDIVTCTQISDGFMIYSSSNMIVSSYSGNIRFPWIFKEIAGGAGIDDYRKVTNDESGGHQFAYTVTGMMQIDRTQANPIWPEISEFLSGRRYEFYDYTKRKIIQVDINDVLLMRLSYIAERYLIVSYGDNKLTHALIYDTGIRRWGKVKIDHVDCFEYIAEPIMYIAEPGIRYEEIVGTYEQQLGSYAAYGHLILGPIMAYNDLVGSYEDQWQRYYEYGGEPIPGVTLNKGQEPYKSIAFLQSNGMVKVINFDLPVRTDNSVLYFGRYQLSRNRFTEIYEIWLENAGSNLILSLLPSLDGTNYLPAIDLKRDKAMCIDRLQKFFANEAATSYAVRLEKDFDLVSLEFVFGMGSYR